jgi:hypothetical protein
MRVAEREGEGEPPSSSLIDMFACYVKCKFADLNIVIKLNHPPLLLHIIIIISVVAQT